MSESRYRMLLQSDSDARLLAAAQAHVHEQ
jgi:hypothetical protein